MVRVRSPGSTECASKQKEGWMDKEAPKQTPGGARTRYSLLLLPRTNPSLLLAAVASFLVNTQELVWDSKAKQANQSFLLGFAHEYFLLEQPAMAPDAEGSISMGKNNNNLHFLLLIVSEEESAGFGVLIPPVCYTSN